MGFFLHISHDEMVACQMILDKMGLKGYQVILHFLDHELVGIVEDVPKYLSFALYVSIFCLTYPIFSWQIGKTKVFLRAGQMADLDARRAVVLGNAARAIQRQIRTYIARKEFILLREAAIHLQSRLRGMFSSNRLTYTCLCYQHTIKEMLSC